MNRKALDQLLAADRMAADSVESEQNKLDHVIASIEQQKYMLREASLHMVEEKAAAVRQQQQKQVEQATSECQRQYNVLMESLDQKYERNHKRWEEELYVRCML